MLFPELKSILSILLLQRQVSLDPVNPPSYAGNSTPLQDRKSFIVHTGYINNTRETPGSSDLPKFRPLVWPIKTFKVGHLSPMSHKILCLSSTKFQTTGPQIMS